MSEEERDNRQAYWDVLDCEPPRYSDEYYLKCYYFWCKVAGPNHFDPYYTVED